MKLAPKHDHSVEIPPKTYDVNSEISYGVKSARNTYQPELAGDIATALKQMGDTETLAAARSVIAGFWQTRLLEIPASATYQYWKSRWEAAFQ